MQFFFFFLSSVLLMTFDASANEMRKRDFNQLLHDFKIINYSLLSHTHVSQSKVSIVYYIPFDCNVYIPDSKNFFSTSLPESQKQKNKNKIKYNEE